MPDESKLSIKKLLAIIVVVIFAFIFLNWLIRYLTTGIIIITTNDKLSNITLSSVEHSTTAQKKGFSVHGKGSLTTKLKRGDYFISVNNNLSGSAQYVKIKGRATTRANLDLIKPTGVEPVTYTNAQTISASGSEFAYFDSSGSGINRINSQNNIHTVKNNYSITSVKWADPDYAIGQNSAGQLFVINKDSVTPLKSPVSSKDDSSVIYTVAPNREIYIGFGSDVYAGKETTGFKKIYSKMPANSLLAAGTDRVSVITNGYTKNKPQIAVAGINGKQKTKGFDLPINGYSAWSKNNKYILIAAGAKGEIFDSSLQQVATIPQSNITFAVWKDDNTLFYSMPGQLWAYDMSQQKTHLIANTPVNADIQNLTVSSDGSYIYLILQNNGGPTQTETISRVGLSGQQVPSYIYGLQSSLPLNYDQYSIGLVNFSLPPTILVEIYPDASGENYTQQAQSNLQSLGFNIGQLHFQQVTPTTGN